MPAAFAQIPDLLTSFDAGGRAMGMGGGIGVSGSDTNSTLSNPAGLAHARKKTLSVVIRNMPQSKTSLSSSFNNPVLTTRSEVGANGLSHAGLTLPLGTDDNPRGTVGISYTIGGFIRDSRTNNGQLPIDASSSVNNYNELLKAKTEFFTIGYGWGNADNSLTLGASLILAGQYVLNRQSYDIVPAGGTAITNPPLDLSNQSYGVGAVVGVQLIPKGSPNTSIGFAVRTPINISGNKNTATYYDTIPGKISVGFAHRKDGLRGGRDFVVFGAQIDTFYKNERGAAFARKRAVNVGAGAEYNLLRGAARIPIRLGFTAVPEAGNGFRDRNALTFGVGYRPFTRPYSIDLNFAAPSSGSGFDAALQLNYRLK